MGESDEAEGMWLTPAQAVAAFQNIDWNTAQQTLAIALADGVIEAMASILREDDCKAVSKAIPADWWDSWAWWEDETFWATGLTTFPQYSSAGYGALRSESRKAYGVKFDAAGLPLLGAGLVVVAAPALAETVASLAPSEPPGLLVSKPLKPVSRAELDRFGELMRAVYPEVTEAMASRIVRAMFPDSAISRDQIRELLPPRRPGRPASRDKIRE
jgi:hypothetical protein